MPQKPDESFATYVGGFRATASKVVPPVTENDQMDMILKTTNNPLASHI